MITKMQIIRDIDKLYLKNTVVTLGKFDGNHLGHRRLFETAVLIKNHNNHLAEGGSEKIIAGTNPAEGGPEKINIGTNPTEGGPEKINIGTNPAGGGPEKINIGTNPAEGGPGKINIGTNPAEVSPEKIIAGTSPAEVSPGKINAGTSSAEGDPGKINIGTHPAGSNPEKILAGTRHQEIPQEIPNCQAVIFTFTSHPGKVTGNNEVRTIQTIEEKNSDKYPEGIDYVIEFPFTRETMSMEPEQFIKDVLAEHLGVRDIVCGNDFHFGKNRSGDVKKLSELGEKYGFHVHVIPKVTVRFDGEEKSREISSTLIKNEIVKGNMEHVAEMLGKPFSVTGVVIHGKHLGNKLGFPTINLAVPEDKILPPDGVYATITSIDGVQYKGMTNVGKRPTFDDGEHRTIETNLFDFANDIYGKTVTVSFLSFVRSEKKFSGIEELTRQMSIDMDHVRTALARMDVSAT